MRSFTVVVLVDGPVHRALSGAVFDSPSSAESSMGFAVESR
ncbi:MAG: hypothetical protein QOF20_2120 [Acidimicrobiaceae bacterium]|nr:hypothetical protein [Acidimicrobiaceae bacterium]